MAFDIHGAVARREGAVVVVIGFEGSIGVLVVVDASVEGVAAEATVGDEEEEGGGVTGFNNPGSSDGCGSDFPSLLFIFSNISCRTGKSLS